MATASSKCLRNTNQKIPREISASNIKPFSTYVQKTLGGGGGGALTPGSDRIKVFANFK